MPNYDDKYRDLNHQKTKNDLFTLLATILTILGFAFLAQTYGVYEDTGTLAESDYNLLAIGIVLFGIGIVFWKRASAIRLKRTERNFLIFCKAYKMLERFAERKTSEDMKNARNSIHDIALLFSGWYTDKAPRSISEIHKSIPNDLRRKAISIIKEKNYPAISSLANEFMNVATQLYDNEIDQNFIESFKKRIQSLPEPTTSEKLEIQKESIWQKFPILRVFWVGIVTGIILYFTLTTMGMEPSSALASSFVGGIALTAMIIQGIKKK